MTKATKFPATQYCNRRNFRTRFNFVLFVLSAESTKFSCTRKPCTYNSVCDTVLAVRKFIAYESLRTLEYEIFTRTKFSAITVMLSGNTREGHCCQKTLLTNNFRVPVCLTCWRRGRELVHRLNSKKQRKRKGKGQVPLDRSEVTRRP